MITLDLPAPLSVNRTRRIDWKNYPKVKEWLRQADAHFLMQKRHLPPPIAGQYGITITLQDGSRIDADNTVKLIIDTIRRYGLVIDDNPTHMRRVVIEFGDVQGCRVTIERWTK
jgi:Holliday junction resolvase RusA-like endonuclease